MADVDKHEIRTTLVFNHVEEETYYLLVKDKQNQAWSLPSSAVRPGQSIRECAETVLNSVSFYSGTLPY